MRAESVIEKLQVTTKEKEAYKSEHRWRQEEEVKLLRRIETKELKRVEREGMLNIQLLDVKSSSHSSSSLERAKGKAYNEKI
jgi:hypothetical protein